MIFQERTYAVLLVSSSEKFFDAMRSQLPGSQYWPVDTVGSGGAARRSLLEREYDLILINAPLKDESGTQFAIDCCEKTASGVLLFVRNDLMEEVAAQGTEYGVLVIAKPTPALLAAIAAAWSMDIAPDLIVAGIKTFDYMPAAAAVSTAAA